MERHTASTPSSQGGGPLQQDYASFAASLAYLLTFDGDRPGYRRALQSFACELEVLWRGLGEVARASRGDDSGVVGVMREGGDAPARALLPLLSDVAEKSALAKQALEAAMLKLTPSSDPRLGRAPGAGP